MIMANGTASKIEVINMADVSECSLAVSEGGPRDLSSVKGHAVCGIEDLALLYWSFRETVLQVTKIVTAKQTQFG
jgi:hypothetical protein